MPEPIIIKTGSSNLKAELNDSPSAKKLLSIMPLEFTMSRWGDEYYGNCGIEIELSPDARDVMEIGEIAIWPTGKAFCIFFGPTPVSTGKEPRAVSPVNPVGKIIENIDNLRKLKSTIQVRIEKLSA